MDAVTVQCPAEDVHDGLYSIYVFVEKVKRITDDVGVHRTTIIYRTERDGGRLDFRSEVMVIFSVFPLAVYPACPDSEMPDKGKKKYTFI